MDCSFNSDLVFIAGLDLNAVLDPLRSPHILMGQLQAEHGVLSLDHVQVLQGLLDLHSCGENQSLIKHLVICVLVGALDQLLIPGDAITHYYEQIFPRKPKLNKVNLIFHFILLKKQSNIFGKMVVSHPTISVHVRHVSFLA